MASAAPVVKKGLPFALLDMQGRPLDVDISGWDESPDMPLPRPEAARTSIVGSEADFDDDLISASVQRQTSFKGRGLGRTASGNLGTARRPLANIPEQHQFVPASPLRMTGREGDQSKKQTSLDGMGATGLALGRQAGAGPSSSAVPAVSIPAGPAGTKQTEVPELKRFPSNQRMSGGLDAPHERTMDAAERSRETRSPGWSSQPSSPYPMTLPGALGYPIGDPNVSTPDLVAKRISERTSDRLSHGRRSEAEASVSSLNSNYSLRPAVSKVSLSLYGPSGSARSSSVKDTKRSNKAALPPRGGGPTAQFRPPVSTSPIRSAALRPLVDSGLPDDGSLVAENLTAVPFQIGGAYSPGGSMSPRRMQPGGLAGSLPRHLGSPPGYPLGATGLAPERLYHYWAGGHKRNRPRSARPDVFSSAVDELSGGPAGTRTATFLNEASHLALEFKRRSGLMPSSVRGSAASLGVHNRMLRGMLHRARPGGAVPLQEIGGGGSLEGDRRERYSGGARPAKSPDKPLTSSLLLEAVDHSDPAKVTFCVLRDRGLTAVDTRGLSGFTELKALDLDENYLSDIHGLTELRFLKELHLCANCISSPIGIDPTDTFLMLEVLDLGYNMLDSQCLTPLSNLPSLKHLTLTGNDLTDFPAEMGPFPCLEVLAANGCGVPTAALRVLCNLTKLRELYLCYNRITRVPGRCCRESSFPALTYLDLSGNLVESAHSVGPLAVLPALKTVVLLGNPFRGVPEALYEQADAAAREFYASRAARAALLGSPSLAAIPGDPSMPYLGADSFRSGVGAAGPSGLTLTPRAPPGAPYLVSRMSRRGTAPAPPIRNVREVFVFSQSQLAELQHRAFERLAAAEVVETGKRDPVRVISSLRLKTKSVALSEQIPDSQTDQPAQPSVPLIRERSFLMGTSHLATNSRARSERSSKRPNMVGQVLAHHGSSNMTSRMAVDSLDAPRPPSGHGDVIDSDVFDPLRHERIVAAFEQCLVSLAGDGLLGMPMDHLGHMGGESPFDPPTRASSMVVGAGTMRMGDGSMLSADMGQGTTYAPTVSSGFGQMDEPDTAGGDSNRRVSTPPVPHPLPTMSPFPMPDVDDLDDGSPLGDMETPLLTMLDDDDRELLAKLEISSARAPAARSKSMLAFQHGRGSVGLTAEALISAGIAAQGPKPTKSMGHMAANMFVEGGAARPARRSAGFDFVRVKSLGSRAPRRSVGDLGMRLSKDNPAATEIDMIAQVALFNPSLPQTTTATSNIARSLANRHSITFGKAGELSGQEISAIGLAELLPEYFRDTGPSAGLSYPPLGPEALNSSHASRMRSSSGDRDRRSMERHGLNDNADRYGERPSGRHSERHSVPLSDISSATTPPPDGEGPMPPEGLDGTHPGSPVPAAERYDSFNSDQPQPPAPEAGIKTAVSFHPAAFDSMEDSEGGWGGPDDLATGSNNRPKSNIKGAPKIGGTNSRKQSVSFGADRVEPEGGRSALTSGASLDSRVAQEMVLLADPTLRPVGLARDKLYQALKEAIERSDQLKPIFEDAPATKHAPLPDNPVVLSPSKSRGVDSVLSTMVDLMAEARHHISEADKHRELLEQTKFHLEAEEAALRAQGMPVEDTEGESTWPPHEHPVQVGQELALMAEAAQHGRIKGVASAAHVHQEHSAAAHAAHYVPSAMF